MIPINNSEHWLTQQAILQPNSNTVKTDSINLTFKELHELCRNAATHLVSSGIREKEHVGIILNHGYEFFKAVNALWFIGAVPVPLSTRNNIKEIEAQLEQANIKFLILSETFSKKLDGINPTIKKIFLPTNFQPTAFDLVKSAFNTLRSALILFTSGSNGKPKAVVHTFKSLFESVKSIDSFSNLSANDVWLSSLPLYHIGGFMILVRSLLTGNTVVYPPTLKHEDIVKAIIKYHPTYFSIVTTTLKRFLEYKFQPHKNLKYIYLGGGPLNSKLSIAAIKEGLPIVKVYGSTETCTMITALAPDEFFLKPNSVGKSIGESKIRIMKKSKNKPAECLPGEIGEIVIQSDSLFKEYYNDRLSTDEKLKDGFYFTGDFGQLDEEGYLYVESRREDLVITGGENVSAKEIELVINLYQGVAESYVFGIPDEEWGQKLCAAVVANNTDENDLIIFLRNKIAGYKIPKKIFFVEEIPKTEMGKVNRSLLFELLNLS